MMFQQQMNYASYMLFIIPMGLFILFFYVNVIMRFVFRVDVSPFKNVDAFSYTNWVKTGSLSKYGIITVIILFIVEIVIGIPFVNLVF